MSRNFQNYEWDAEETRKMEQAEETRARFNEWRAQQAANPPALPPCPFCQTQHHAPDSCPTKACRACSGRGGQYHAGAHVSEPCGKCRPSDAEYKAYLDSKPSEYGWCLECETTLTAKEYESGEFCIKCRKSEAA